MPYLRRIVHDSKLPWEFQRPKPVLVLESIEAEIRPWKPIEGELQDTFLDEEGRAWHLVWLDEAINWQGEAFAYVLVRKTNPVYPLDEQSAPVELILIADPSGLTEETFDLGRLVSIGVGRACLRKP